MPTDPEDASVVTVKLFESNHLGMGDALSVRDFKYNRVHGSVDNRSPGQMRMGLGIEELVSANFDFTPRFATEWFDSDGTTNVVYIIEGDSIWQLKYGALIEIGTDSLGSTCQHGMLDDNGSGVPFLYACFGATGANIRRMDLAKAVTTSDDVKADKFLSLNGDAYRSIQPTGGSAASQVSKCPFGADRFANANWGAGQPVGFAGSSVNALASVRQAPVAIKPEGVFAYNESLDRWINYMPGWEKFRHSRSGIGAFSLGDQLVIPILGGGAIIFDGYSVRPFDAIGRESSPNQHTTAGEFTGGIVTALSTTRQWVVGLTGITRKMIAAGDDLLFFKEESSAFTEFNDEVRDANPATGATFSLGGSSDHLYIGWSHPFAGMRWIGAPGSSNNSIAATLTLAVGLTDSTWATVTARDFTQGTGLTVPLQRNNTAIIMSEDPVAKGWKKTSVNGVSAYWVRLTYNVALSANVTWNILDILPWHPSLDQANFPLDGMDRSGALPHILFGRADDNEMQWHDMGSLPLPDEIGDVVYANTGGGSSNTARQLLIIGRFSIWRMHISHSDIAGTETNPFLNDIGISEASAFEPAPGKVVRLKRVKIMGREFDANLPLRFYYTWDYGKPWNLGFTTRRAPGEFNIADSGRGNLIRWAIGWKQTGVTPRPTQPDVTMMEAEFEVLEDSVDSIQERPFADTPVF